MLYLVRFCRVGVRAERESIPGRDRSATATRLLDPRAAGGDGIADLERPLRASDRDRLVQSDRERTQPSIEYLRQKRGRLLPHSRCRCRRGYERVERWQNYF